MKIRSSYSLSLTHSLTHQPADFHSLCSALTVASSLATVNGNFAREFFFSALLLSHVTQNFLPDWGIEMHMSDN
jgi:hypothetical protein